MVRTLSSKTSDMSIDSSGLKVDSSIHDPRWGQQDKTKVTENNAQKLHTSVSVPSK